ncbi:ParB/RepB/Spo0J family partition protein [Endozoicomonas sp. ALC066]|uniref:ParB/RepB/Spo0J family partition protein n=1 Tax=Endozoicomonas sp. ALC066 TaxID=3403078 RepID=UPI003BB58953
MNIFKDLSNEAKEAILRCQLEFDPSPLKEAQLYAAALSMPGVTQSLLSTAIDRKRSDIAGKLRLLKLPDPVQKLVHQHKISFSQARVLLTAHPDTQERLAQECVINAWTVRELIDAVQLAQPSISDLQQRAQNLYEKHGLICSVKKNDKGHYFVTCAFEGSQGAAEFIQRIERAMV